MTGKEHNKFSIIAVASSAEQVQQLASQSDIDIGASSQTQSDEPDISEVDDPYEKPSVVTP
jgi:hypothetical protein